jgi:hypothetical protein
MENLTDSASLQSGDKNAPLNAGIKQLRQRITSEMLRNLLHVEPVTVGRLDLERYAVL